MILATTGLLNLVHVQWILGHVGLEGNTEADLEARHHITSLQHLWISFPFTRPSNSINRASLTTGIAATHTPESIGCSLAVSISSSAGNVTEAGTSALRWPSYALVILRCWQHISIESGDGTLPHVHTTTALTRWQSTWCYSV